MVHVATEFDESADIVVRDAVDGEACCRCLSIEKFRLVIGHQPGRNLLMGDLEVDAK